MPMKSASIVFLTIADLALAVNCFLAMALVHQRATSQAALSNAEAQRDAAIAGRAAFRNPDSTSPRTVPSDQLVRQELLGIQGSLKRLVFVLDKSGSMARGRKWNYTRGIVDTWLRYLDIEHCALVIFDDSVSVFPSAGGYLNLTGVDGARNREAVLARLGQVEPSGNTNTIAALRRAYALDPTSIVLASDGFPDRGLNRFDVQMARHVIELCRTHDHSVPVHVLALGNYFQPRLGKFLWTIADVTGGTFLAR